MFWEDVEPIMTERLERAVERAYDVFAGYMLSGLIVHCDCNVCMTTEQARQLSTLPLGEIACELLAEYTNSAHGYDDGRIEHEFKHFLPRYLDCIAHCRPPTALGAEVVLDRLGAAAYRTRWPADEIDVVDEFFDAFIEASLHQLVLLEWPVGNRLEYDMGEVLGMVVRAGGDLERALQAFDRAPDPQAAVHMASLRGDIDHKHGRARYRNAHLDEHPEAAESIARWLRRDSVTERIVAAAGLLDDPRYDDVLDLGLP